MSTISNMHLSTMQGLHSLFSFKWFSQKSRLSPQVQHQQAEFAERMKLNHADIGDVFCDVRQHSLFLLAALKSKKLNRKQLCTHLDDLVVLAGIGESYLVDRERIEKRFRSQQCGYPATVPSIKGSKNRGK